MPVVTALRACSGDRIEIVLDGAPWRTVPLAAVVDARLAVDVELDRARARDLNRSLRHHAAVGHGLRSLRWGSRSYRELDRRMAQSGIREQARREALGTLERVGLVDDARAALARATTLAERAAGDAMIAVDLETRGFDPPAIASAMECLAPESERAAAFVARRGQCAKTLRYLAARGFSEETVQDLVARVDADA